jgi:hypothetical protein
MNELFAPSFGKGWKLTSITLWPHVTPAKKQGGENKDTMGSENATYPNTHIG